MKLTSQHKERFKKNLHHYQGRAVGFKADEVSIPGPQLAQREYMDHPGAVGALALTTSGKIVLVKQYRYPVAEFTYEIPAGKLDKGEDPFKCVHRELEEETGYRAKKISKLVAFWPTAAFSNEVIHLYVAEGLVQVEAHPDEDEFLEVVAVSRQQLEKWIKQGKIRDSKTVIAYLAWKNFRGKR